LLGKKTNGKGGEEERKKMINEGQERQKKKTKKKKMTRQPRSGQGNGLLVGGGETHRITKEPYYKKKVIWGRFGVRGGKI